MSSIWTKAINLISKEPERQILDLIWNLPTLDVRHVPECGILILKVPTGDMAIQCLCFLVLNSNGWADFLSNPVLPFDSHSGKIFPYWCTGQHFQHPRRHDPDFHPLGTQFSWDCGFSVLSFLYWEKCQTRTMVRPKVWVLWVRKSGSRPMWV